MEFSNWELGYDSTKVPLKKKKKKLLFFSLRSPASHLLSGPESCSPSSSTFAFEHPLAFYIAKARGLRNQQVPKSQGEKGRKLTVQPRECTLLSAGPRTLHLLGWSAGPQGQGRQTRQTRSPVTLDILEQGGAQAILRE